jgi:kynurenine formamidase
MSTAPRWIRRPEGATWGDYGPDDQLGRLNLLTPKKLLQGLAEASEGLAFCLSLPLDYPGGSSLNPRRKPPVLRPTLRGDTVNFNAEIPGSPDVLCDDLVILHLQYSTQWDALCHVGHRFDTMGDGNLRKVYYNGFRAGEDVSGSLDIDDAGLGPNMKVVSTSRAHKLGIENVAAKAVQGRGVMTNLRAHLGDAPRRVGYDTLMRVMEADGVEVESGDILCLHTGFAQLVLEMGGHPDAERLHKSCTALDGRDARLLNWITDSNIAALVADNYAVEAFPAAPCDGFCSILPLHEHCLFKLGVILGELWHLTPLADWLRAHGRSRFLLTAPPLRLPGAAGSPVTPVATV